jgi:hypothetical protein
MTFTMSDKLGLPMKPLLPIRRRPGRPGCSISFAIASG